MSTDSNGIDLEALQDPQGIEDQWSLDYPDEGKVGSDTVERFAS